MEQSRLQATRAMSIHESINSDFCATFFKTNALVTCCSIGPVLLHPCYTATRLESSSKSNDMIHTIRCPDIRFKIIGFLSIDHSCAIARWYHVAICHCDSSYMLDCGCSATLNCQLQDSYPSPLKRCVGISRLVSLHSIDCCMSMQAG